MSQTCTKTCLMRLRCRIKIREANLRDTLYTASRPLRIKVGLLNSLMFQGSLQNNFVGPILICG